jgi:hypothetical protein
MLLQIPSTQNVNEWMFIYLINFMSSYLADSISYMDINY